MGDQSTVLTETEARHLLRRATFSPDPRSVGRLVGKTRGDAADRLVRGRGTGRKLRGKDFQEMHDSWVNYCISQRRRINEKLVIFWHDHFATNADDVDDLALMAQQNRLLRRHGKGNLKGQNFKDFVKAINKDAAMMVFLNTVDNTKNSPNENYGRELLELFTVAVEDLLGNENYSQEDIVEIARAFTGWDYDEKGVAVLNASKHDNGAPKTIFTEHGGFGPGGRDITANGVGEAEIDTVIDILFDHTDSQGMNTVARHIAHKLLTYFAGESPPLTAVDDVVAASNFDASGGDDGAWNIAALVREILVHDFFYSTVAQPVSVKFPIHYVVETLSLCGMRLAKKRTLTNNGFRNRYHLLNANGGQQEILDQLEDMGQILLKPPSVFGWDWESAWVNSGTLLARYNFASRLARARGKGSKAFRPERLVDTSLTEAGDIVDAVTAALAVKDQFPPASPERDALIDYITENGTLSPPFDLDNQVFRDVKLNGLFTLVLESPAYQLQ